MIKKAMPSKEGRTKTFFKVIEKVVTSSISQAQWVIFLEKLEQINYRDALIAKIILQ